MIQVVLGETHIDIRAAGAVIFDEQSFSVDAIREELETLSLFGEPKTIALLYTLSEFRDQIFDLLKEHTDSVHTIIIRERALSATDEKALAKLGAKIIGKSIEKKAVEFNIWSLTDALLARDKKKAWLLYREAIDNGTAPEEIGGILWWQMKTLLLVVREGNLESVKPFVASKAKQALKKYTTEEIEMLSKKLISAIHEPRAGNGKAEETLEAFVLSL